MHAASLERMKLRSDLQGSIEDEVFVLNYQPIVSLRTEEITGRRGACTVAAYRANRGAQRASRREACDAGRSRRLKNLGPVCEEGRVCLNTVGHHQLSLFGEGTLDCLRAARSR